MYVPRWILLSLMVAAATICGWGLHGLVMGGSAVTDISAVGPATTPRSSGSPTNVAVDGGNSAPVINLTIDDLGHSGSTEHASSDADRGAQGRASATGRRAGAVVLNAGSSMSRQASSSGSPGGPQIVYVADRRSGDDDDDDGDSTVVHETLVNNDSRITVNGNEIVVASDGSIVFQGDNGSLNGNTGDSSSSGSIAIDNNGSTVSTGTSGGRTTVSVTPTTQPGAVEGGEEDPAAAPNDDAAELAGARFAGAASLTDARGDGGDGGDATAMSKMSEMSMATPDDRVAPTATADGGSSARSASRTSADDRVASAAEQDVIPTAFSPTSPLWGWSLNPRAGRAVSISGYEDHSITVDGNDQIILYDDSNVFIDRNGQVNANTGDTDSSGLNVVDAVDSIVRSGNSGDGEGSGDDEEEEDEDEMGGVFGAQEADMRVTPLSASAPVSTRSGAAAVATPMAGAASGSVDDEDTTTSASGDDTLIIGGDGYDDLGVRSRGNRNIVVYDDSNLVIGGTGGVNAQIGDSDTGGAVVMGVRNSLIEAGCEGDLCPLYQR